MEEQKTKQNRQWVKKVLVGFLFCLSALVGGGLGYFKYQLLGSVKQGEVSFQEINEQKEQEEEVLPFDKDIVNILLVGADAREEWQDSGRSDSTMIATLDLKHGKLKLTSLMRDMYIDIPGYGKNRFNAAYNFGGVALLNETIATNFDVRLDGYIVVDFKAFRDVINKIGGVEIELTELEAQYLNTAYHGKIKVVTGKQKLKGKEALAYTRIRQVPSLDGNHYDFGRTERQRRVLDSIFSQFKNQNFHALTDVLMTVLSNITTDLTPKQMEQLAFSVLKVPDKEIKQLCIPIQDSCWDLRVALPGTSNNAQVLGIDVEQNKEAIYEFIYEPEPEVTKEVENTEETTDGSTVSSEQMPQDKKQE